MDVSDVKALIFDVFGTVVDWRSIIIKHGQQFGKRYGAEADWDAFVDAWRGKYRPFMDKVRHGELPWTNLDGLHRMALEEVLGEFKITGISDDAKAEFNLARHYKPDPESYLTAVELLSLQPQQVMMVAAHQGDLLAAGKLGLKTGFVPRPMEHGPGQTPDPTPDPSFTVVANDFMDLADKLNV